MLFTQNRIQIGIDITKQQVRATRLLNGRHGLELLDAIILPIQFTLIETLKRVRKWIKCQREKVIIALDYDEVICKTVALTSNLNHAELSTYIKNQSLKLFGLNAEAIDFDYQPLPYQAPNHIWQIVAVKKLLLQELIAQSQAAQLNLQAIEINVLTLSRLYYFLHKSSVEKNGKIDNIAIIIIHPLHLQFSVINNYQLIHHSTSALPTKCLPSHEPHLLATLQHMLQCYRQVEPHHFLQAIYLTGENKFLQSIAEHLQAITKISVRVAELLPQRLKMQIPFDGRLLVSFALALRGFVP